MNRAPVLRHKWRLAMAGIYVVLVASVFWQLWRVHALGAVPLGLAGLALILLRDFSGYQAGLAAATPDIVLPAGLAGQIRTSLWQRPSRRGILSAALVALLAFALGKLLDSTTLQLFALGLLAVSWLAGIVGWTHLGGLLVLIGLICLPQGLVHEGILLYLQRLAAGMASWGLDVARVAHVPQGAVLEMVQGNLFVEDACSGMQSLLTGLMVAQIYFSWHRDGLLFSLGGLAGTALLLLLGNGLRIFIIALLYARFDIDWTAGWRHEMTGLVVYLGVLALLPSMRALLLGVGSVRDVLVRAYFKWRFPWVVRREKHGGAAETEARPQFKPLGALRAVALLIPASVCWVVLGMAVAGAIELAVFRETGVAEGQVAAKGLPRLAAIELPNELAGWHQDPAGKQVSFIEQFSLDQRLWCFRKGALQAWVAADLPFDQLHQLRNCYLNRDWHIVKEGVIANPELSAFALLELRPQDNTRPPMLVLFDNYDLTRKQYVGGVPTRLGGRWQMMCARLKGNAAADPAEEGGPFCQVQVVLAGALSLDSSAGAQAQQLLAAARIAFAERLSGKTTD